MNRLTKKIPFNLVAFSFGGGYGKRIFRFRYQRGKRRLIGIQFQCVVRFIQGQVSGINRFGFGFGLCNVCLRFCIIGFGCGNLCPRFCIVGYGCEDICAHFFLVGFSDWYD